MFRYLLVLNGYLKITFVLLLFLCVVLAIIAQFKYVANYILEFVIPSIWIIGGSYLVSSILLRCPSCGYRVGIEGGKGANKFSSVKEPDNFPLVFGKKFICPNCGTVYRKK